MAEKYITLPEVNVYPSLQQKLLMHSIPDIARMDMYNQLIELNKNDVDPEGRLQNQINRTANILHLAGFPKIYNNAEFTKRLAKPYEHLVYGDAVADHPYYLFGENAMYNIGDMDSFIAEVSHPIQLEYGTKFKFQDNLKNYINTYDDPENLEYETHKVFQPQIKDYIINGNIQSTNTKLSNALQKYK